MNNPFEIFLEKKRNDPFVKFLRKREVLDRVEKELTPAIRSYVRASLPKSLTPEQISEMVIAEITKRPHQIINKTIKHETIRPIETIKETKVKEDKELRKEIEALKRELELFKAVLPLGGSGVMGLPSMSGQGGKFLTTDGGKPSWAAASTGSDGTLTLGDGVSTGSWRFRVSGTDLLHERLESGIWVEKGRDVA